MSMPDLRLADIIEAITDTLAGKRDKAQLGTWAHLAMLRHDTGSVLYEQRHSAEIHATLYELMFMSEGPEYYLEDDELRALAQDLRRLRLSRRT